MGAVTVFFTPNGILAVDGGTATSLAVQRLEQMVVNGEATSAVINVIDGSAPVVERMADVDTARSLWNAFESQNASDYVKESFAAAIGVLAGLAVSEFGPWASILTDRAASDLFKAAYDAASSGSAPATRAWLDLLQGDYSWNGLKAIKHLKGQYKLAKKIVSPIVLDLNGDGISTVGLGGGVNFDHDANGFAERTGWANGKDGILVRDLNGNGRIDSGPELFGSETLLANGLKAANGYAALSATLLAARLSARIRGPFDEREQRA